MARGIPTTVICGHPVKFYNLDRPRDDYAPACHRSPHEGSHHLSRAAIERTRERRLARRRGEAVLSDPPATVTLCTPRRCRPATRPRRR